MSHKHDLPEFLSTLYDVQSSQNPKEYYVTYYKQIMHGNYDKNFIHSFIKNMIDENHGLFKCVFLYTLFNTSLNMRLFFIENKKFYNFAKEKYVFFCKTNKKFEEAVPKFDVLQDYYEYIEYIEYIIDCYMSKTSESLLWNDFSEQIDDSENILSNCISFL